MIDRNVIWEENVKKKEMKKMEKVSDCAFLPLNSDVWVHLHSLDSCLSRKLPECLSGADKNAYGCVS